MPVWLLCIEIALQAFVVYLTGRTLLSWNRLTKGGKIFLLITFIFFLLSTVGRLCWAFQGLSTPFWMGEGLVIAIFLFLFAS